MELQPGTCPGQLGDGEEVDAEWEVHKVEVHRKPESLVCAEKKNHHPLLWGTPSEPHLHYWKGSLFSYLSHGLCLCISGSITIQPM